MVVKKLVVNGIEHTFRYDAQTGRMQVFGGEQGELVFAVTDVFFDAASKTLFFSVDGQPHSAFIDQTAAQAAQIFLLQYAQPIDVAVATQTAPSFGPAKRDFISSSTIKSPLAGRVVRVVVQQGHVVREGQPLLFIESMKMENEICAPKAAIIKTIFIVEGNVVQPEQLLIEFEKEKEGEVDASRQVKYEQKAV